MTRTFRPALAALVFAISTCSASPAASQVDPQLAPPVALSSTEVPYPEGAKGDAAVALELVIEKDGSVSSATVLEGAEPFAAQARAAALGWTFTPAQRGDVPIRARIVARVNFRQEELEDPDAATAAEIGPAPEKSAGGTPPSPAAPAARPPAQSLEIVVRGERREIGQTTLAAEDVREMPGAFGDPFRAIEALPGVAPIISGFPYFYVRGAPPNNNGYFVDGVRVPFLFHLGLGEGVIHPALIERVDFFPGAAPAKYGGAAGAVIVGQTRKPAEKFHGEANLRLVDAGALVETPFGDGASALIAGRYGYPGPVLSSFAPDVEISYWDYQARAAQRFGDHHALSVFAFGSHDYLATGEGEDREEELVSDFHRVDLRYDHETDAGRVRVAVTGGYDSQGAEPSYITNRMLAARLELERQLAPSVRWIGGFDGSFDKYGFRQTPAAEFDRLEPPSSANPPPENLRWGAHLGFLLELGSRVELVPSVRFDLYRTTRSDPDAGNRRVISQVPAVDPRFAARVELTPAVALVSTLGLSHQYPSLRVGEIPAPLLTVPGFPLGSDKLQSAAQLTQGVELSLPGDITGSVTGFLSHFEGLTDLTADCFQLIPGMTMMTGEGPPNFPWVCPNQEPARGEAYGVEVLFRRPITKRWSGLISYTLSRSERDAHFVTLEGEDTSARVPSDNDRTHVLNVLSGYDFGRGYRASGRFLFFTGEPYSKRDGEIPIPPYHGFRQPDFYRVDVRFEKRWRLGDEGFIAFVLEGMNVTLQKQSAGLDCRGELRRTPTGVSSTTECKPAMIGPITIPSVGVEAVF
jgi:hypothetical protein